MIIFLLRYFYMMIVATPNKDMNPTISVMVVNITPPARAGSISIFFRIRGRLTPLIAPMIRLIIKAEAITVPKNTIKPQINCNRYNR